MNSYRRKGWVLALLLASAALAAAQTYSVLYSFSGAPDGEWPQAPVTLDPSTGNLYGVTGGGGSGGCQYPGCGTVFELTPIGVERVLHSFTNSPDGAGPIDVLLDSKGNLFGTTGGGGVHGGPDGTVFQIDPNGTETVLYSFTGGVDGKQPDSGLIQDPNTGDFYGVTVAGGAYGDAGAVYKITATGSESVVYSFGAPGTSGSTPEGKLVQDGKTRNLYGMDPSSPLGCGMVFEVTPAGVETTLYAFTGHRGDGCEPGPGNPGLVMDAQGNLFGTTLFGGSSNHGVVFEVTAGGVEKVIYRFKGAKKGDGAWPYAGLLLDESTGNLYGTTEIGGTGQCVSGKAHGCGTVFELSPPTTKHGKWRETVLHSFAGGADGYYPSAGLTWNPQTGNLYGTAVLGGTYNWGVVFELIP
ncbi:MAG: choice-of-anchor tandem repeat GloVer-containing protein [Terriglobales bacterium]